jgi:hypothetical protein
MIELKLLLTEDEARVLENAMLNYAARLERIQKEDASPAHAHEAQVLAYVSTKYIAAVA